MFAAEREIDRKQDARIRQRRALHIRRRHRLPARRFARRPGCGRPRGRPRRTPRATRAGPRRGSDSDLADGEPPGRSAALLTRPDPRCRALRRGWGRRS
jgi:hypothetical protein